VTADWQALMGGPLANPSPRRARYGRAMQWHRLPEAPIAARASAHVSCSAQALLVWGGVNDDGQLLDGAVFERGPRVWRPVDRAPLAPRLGAAVGELPGGIVVWGGLEERDDDWENPGLRELDDGAILDAADGSWRALPPAPLGPRAGAKAVWTGREVLVWGGVSGSGRPGGPRQGCRDGACYDPARGSWRTIAPCPLSPGDDARALWAGRSLLLVTGGRRRPRPQTGVSSARGERGRTPQSTGAHETREPLARRLLAYDPQADAWHELPAPPFELEHTVPFWIADQLVWLDFTDGRLVVWRPGKETPRALPALPGGRAAIQRAERIVMAAKRIVQLLRDGERSTPGGASGPVRGWSWGPGQDEWTPVPVVPLAAPGGLGIGVGDGALAAFGGWRAGRPDVFYRDSAIMEPV